MLNKSVARRYSKALLNIALEEKSIDKYQSELNKVIATINEVDGFKEYLNNFLIPVAEKKELIEKIFAQDVSYKTLNFLKIIIDKRREEYLELILEEFIDLADEERNVKKADLYTAVKVPESYITILTENLSAAMGIKVKLEQNIDPALIGGVKIRIGDKIIDATVKKRLEILEEKLKFAKIS